MASFYNQARLSFRGRVTNSNVTEGEVVSRVSITKQAVSSDYGPGDGIIYAVTLINSDSVEKNDITLTDNLGRFTPPGSSDEVIPLSYVTGSVLYYQNGVLQPAPTVTAGDELIISGIDIPAGGNVLILYEVRANEYAPLGLGASITNRARITGCDLCDELSDEATIPTRNEADVSIAKAISPQTVSCGDELTYTFIIQNSGNTAVVATDNLIVYDTFNPALENIIVRLNGVELVKGVSYSYNEATGEFSTLGGAIPVPAATFVRDNETGVITTTPGVAILTVRGNLKT